MVPEFCADCRGLPADDTPGFGAPRPLVRLNGPVMLARYEGTCRVCQDPVEPGDLIVETSRGWTHEECAP